MTSFFVYSKVTGAVQYRVRTTVEALTALYVGDETVGFEEVLHSDHPGDFYYDGQALAPFLELGESSEVVGMDIVLSSLPPGTAVECEGEREVSQGTLTIEVPEPGNYWVFLYPPFGYKKKVLEFYIS